MVLVWYRASFDENGVMVVMSVKLCTFLWSFIREEATNRE